MGKTLTEIAQTLKDTDKKVQLIYAFNGVGKTRLSREFKELVEPKLEGEEAAAEEEETKSTTTTTAQQAAQPEEDYIINERDVNYYWQEYAGRMPKEQVAIAKRMQNMRVTLLNDTTFEAVVDNEIVSKEFTAMIPHLQEYLRARLKNRKVTMTVRISAPTEKVHAYGRVEKFQMMVQKNDALLQLKNEFGLELY